MGSSLLLFQGATEKVAWNNWAIRRVHIYGKSWVVLVQIMKAYRGSGSTAPSILKCGTRLRWVVLLHTPVTLLLKVSTPHWTGGCIGLTASLDALRKRKISCPCRKFYHASLSSNPQATELHYTDYTNILFLSDCINLLIFHRMCALTSAYLPLASDDRTHTCSRKTLARKPTVRRAANNHLAKAYGVTSSSSFW